MDLALETLIDILELDYLPATHADYLKQLSLKKDAAVSVMNAGLKADENRFRRKQQDVLQKLWDRVKSDRKLEAIMATPASLIEQRAQ